MEDSDNTTANTTRYTYSEAKTLGKALKAEIEKVKILKKIKRSRE